MKSSGSAIHLYSSCLILVVWKYQYREWSLCCNILLVGKDRFLFVYNPCNSPTWQPAGKVGTMEKRGHIRPQALAWVHPHPALSIPSKTLSIASKPVQCPITRSKRRQSCSFVSSDRSSLRYNVPTLVHTQLTTFSSAPELMKTTYISKEAH